ncbi:uncharacterized protein GGS22DRAFT_198053 [Annulohypoxylon maeteangense]|uniref:uncharacterized protein n=1 Tax=Annulohypoxylon maeteangense TaxID=1927788 RepID=UPI0020073923|nr:uncharacterized protein GGS22DRAFT_198053 [Annulohypoxylon maeteangense]KAI0888247.1 hypothetical protein GGS22DRAFT_198053 [Annulohypoxylon maeteangense]
MNLNTEFRIYPSFSGNQLRILDKLDVALRSRHGPEWQAQRMVGDILRICAEADSLQRLSSILRDLWAVVILLASQFSSDGQDQRTLVNFIETLREREDEVRKGSNIFWKDLPYLADCLSENWNDPLSSSRRLTQRDMTEWENLNSFVARLTNKNFCPWLQLPIKELRNALECPQSRGAVMECRVLVATDWIIRCGDVLLHKLTGENADRHLALSLVTGPLCRNVPLLGVERWAFWSKRFQEIGNNYQKLELNDAIYLRIGKALRVMSAFERERAYLDRT